MKFNKNFVDNNFASAICLTVIFVVGIVTAIFSAPPQRRNSAEIMDNNTICEWFHRCNKQMRNIVFSKRMTMHGPSTDVTNATKSDGVKRAQARHKTRHHFRKKLTPRYRNANNYSDNLDISDSTSINRTKLINRIIRIENSNNNNSYKYRWNKTNETNKQYELKNRSDDDRKLKSRDQKDNDPISYLQRGYFGDGASVTRRRRSQQPISCFSCASAEYEPLYSRSENLFSFGQPQQFDRACDTHLDLQTFAPAILCDTTCISVLEPQYFGGILNEQRPYSYVRGCATDVFAVANAAHETEAGDYLDTRMPSPEMERLLSSEICVLLPIQDLWPELFPIRRGTIGAAGTAGELVRVCSCKSNTCNTHDASCALPHHGGYTVTLLGAFFVAANYALFRRQFQF